MYVCLCHAVSDRDVRKLISEGASTLAEITECTGAGSRCGSCIPELCQILNETQGATALPLRRALKVIPSSNAA